MLEFVHEYIPEALALLAVLLVGAAVTTHSIRRKKSRQLSAQSDAPQTQPTPTKTSVQPSRTKKSLTKKTQQPVEVKSDTGGKVLVNTTDGDGVVNISVTAMGYSKSRWEYIRQGLRKAKGVKWANSVNNGDGSHSMTGVVAIDKADDALAFIKRIG